MYRMGLNGPCIRHGMAKRNLAKDTSRFHPNTYSVMHLAEQGFPLGFLLRARRDVAGHLVNYCLIRPRGVICVARLVGFTTGRDR